MVKARILITWAVTFTVFSLEAFIHYSMGKGKIELPEWHETLKLMGIVLVTSFLSAVVSQLIIQTTLPRAKKGHLIKRIEKQIDFI